MQHDGFAYSVPNQMKNPSVERANLSVRVCPSIKSTDIDHSKR